MLRKKEQQQRLEMNLQAFREIMTDELEGIDDALFLIARAYQEDKKMLYVEAIEQLARGVKYML